MIPNLLYKPKVFKNVKGTWTAAVYSPHGVTHIERHTWDEAFTFAFKNAKLQMNRIYY